VFPFLNASLRNAGPGLVIVFFFLEYSERVTQALIFFLFLADGCGLLLMAALRNRQYLLASAK